VKIVRDHIPALHQAGELKPEGPRPDWTFRRAESTERKLLLRLKLAEEVGEVLSAPDQAKVLDELHDLRDVIDALIVNEAQPSAQEEAERRHTAKLDRLGGFGWGWVLEDGS